ncbi:MAG: F0F1 ATP synthase subunit epsilon [Aureliella sp.]
MKLKLQIPSQVVIEVADVLRIIVETNTGSFGLLPHRLDCVAALVPGILVYETQSEGELYVATDEGSLVKCGMEVLVSVRRAIPGTDLTQLREAVEREYLQLSKREQEVRAVIARMESGFVRRLVDFQK